MTNYFLTIFVWVAVLGGTVDSAKKKTSINVAFFLDKDEFSGITRFAIENALREIKATTKYTIQAEFFEFRNENVYEAGQRVCELVKKGLAAIFGPESPGINEVIQSVSSSLQIPQFQTIWNPKLTSFSALNANRSNPIFNLHPSSAALSRALATLVRENDWKSYTVIYENDDGLLRLRGSLKRKASDPAVTFRKLGPGPNYRSILKQIKQSQDVRFILDCKTSNILEVLRQAKEINLLENYHSYILTDLNAHTLNWPNFMSVEANITAIRLLDTKSQLVGKAIKSWKIGANTVNTRTALIHDALNIFITAFRDMSSKFEPVISPLDCRTNKITEHGAQISEVIRKHRYRKEVLPGPLTGPAYFDDNGQRNNFELQIIEYSTKEPSRFRLAGTWNSNTNLIDYFLTSETRKIEMQQRIQSKNFRVVSKIGAPYLMKIENVSPMANENDKYRGYSKDLMQEICNILNCNFTLQLVPDGKYGNYDPFKKEWNGLIRHLLDRKADVAICDLTITYERRRAVDFTVPFMTLGISVLYAKAVKEPPELLSFTKPLSLEIWLYMATSYLVISMIIFLAARLNPNDWENPHPCDPEPEELENIWSIRNCCWLTLGSIMAQGCDILPKGISTRMATAAWWFFSLIMTASYTANLAAFLTMERMGFTIEKAEDLAGQTKIKFGCVNGGATCSFFRDTNFSTYHQMWVQMESAGSSVFAKDNEDGVSRVLRNKRKYAFLMESSGIEYETERNCDLVQVGGPIDSKGYGIAMNTNFEYRKAFNEAILRMQERGILRDLKERWWKKMDGGGRCSEHKQSSDEAAAELGLDNVGGVFVVLAGGVGIALLFATCEFLWNVKKIAVREHISLKESMEQELRFAFNIWNRQKAVRRDISNLSSNGIFK